MTVDNSSKEVVGARRTAIELLLSDHLGDCIGPCQGVCPAHMEIPRMIREISEGKYREALITVKRDIALPAVLGRICPELCEKGCRRGSHDGPVAVCMLKRFVADQDLASEFPYRPECGRRAGNGSRSSAPARQAWQRRTTCCRRGTPARSLTTTKSPEECSVTASEEALPREVLDAEIAIIEEMGAEFRCGVRVGTTGAALSDLRSEFDAMLLAGAT